MIIQVSELCKNYGNINAVNGISFTVNEGDLFSFLGTNGAGKSTTIGILTTLLPRTSGKVTVGGYDPDVSPEKVREQLGIVFQDGVLDPLLTVRENLEIRGSLYGLNGKKLRDVSENAINITDMGDYAIRPYGKLSGGQKRRADIARALVNMPKILFLDEPTTGLDPKTRRDIWNLVRNLQKQNGMTVFLTTHYMEEAVESDRISIIHKGEIKAEGTPSELKNEYCSDTLKLTLTDGTYIEKRLHRTVEALPIIDGYKRQIGNVEIINGTLDDVFLNITGGAADVNKA